MFWKNQTRLAQHDEVIPVFSDGFMLLTVELNLSLKLRLLSFLSLPKTDVEIINWLLSENNMCCNRRDVWCISWVTAKRLSINWNLAKRRKMWVNKLTDKMGDGNKSSCVVWSFCSRCCAGAWIEAQSLSGSIGLLSGCELNDESHPSHSMPRDVHVCLGKISQPCKGWGTPTGASDLWPRRLWSGIQCQAEK